MISYYELLGMIAEGNIPKKIKLHLISQPQIYKREDDGYEFSHYYIEDEDNIDENYRAYLSESLLESTMYEKNIEIIGNIETLNLDYYVSAGIKDKVLNNNLCNIIENQRTQEDKINEIIKVLNRIEKED